MIPTKEEYEKALKDKDFANIGLREGYKEREALIEQLCVSQKHIQHYATILNDVERVITMYEIYHEVQNG